MAIKYYKLPNDLKNLYCNQKALKKQLSKLSARCDSPYEIWTLIRINSSEWTVCLCGITLWN